MAKVAVYSPTVINTSFPQYGLSEVIVIPHGCSVTNVVPNYSQIAHINIDDSSAGVYSLGRYKEKALIPNQSFGSLYVYTFFLRRVLPISSFLR